MAGDHCTFFRKRKEDWTRGVLEYIANFHGVLSGVRIDVPYDRPSANLKLNQGRMLKAEVVDALQYGGMTLSWTPLKDRYKQMNRAYHALLRRYIRWRKHNRGGHVISYRESLARTVYLCSVETLRPRQGSDRSSCRIRSPHEEKAVVYYVNRRDRERGGYNHFQREMDNILYLIRCSVKDLEDMLKFHIKRGGWTTTAL